MKNAAQVPEAAGRAPGGSAPRRFAIAAAAITAAGLAAITGCSTARQAAAPVVTVTATASAAAAVSASPSAASSATAAPEATVLPLPSPSPAGPPPCATRDLQVKPGVAQGTPSATYQVLDFTNISNVTCTLYGYPGVALAGGQPVTQIGRAAAESKAPARELLTLAPEAVASALLQIVHAGTLPPSKCHPVTATYLQIYPPNQTTPSYLGYTAPTCAKPVQILTVSVVQPGAGSAS